MFAGFASRAQRELTAFKKKIEFYASYFVNSIDLPAWGKLMVEVIGRSGFAGARALFAIPHHFRREGVGHGAHGTTLRGFRPGRSRGGP